jgi:hypothetical protein
MRHRAHFIVLTMPTDRSLGTMLSDSNEDVHTLQFALRGECHRAVQGGDADRSPGFLQDGSRSHWSAEQSRNCRIPRSEEAHDEFTHAHFCLSACRSRLPPGD